MVFAAFSPGHQTAALVGGFISVASFLCLGWAVGGYKEAIGRVLVADVVALGLLIAGGGAHALRQREGRPLHRAGAPPRAMKDPHGGSMPDASGLTAGKVPCT